MIVYPLQKSRRYELCQWTDTPISRAHIRIAFKCTLCQESHVRKKNCSLRSKGDRTKRGSFDRFNERKQRTKEKQRNRQLAAHSKPVERRNEGKCSRDTWDSLRFEFNLDFVGNLRYNNNDDGLATSLGNASLTQQQSAWDQTTPCDYAGTVSMISLRRSRSSLRTIRVSRLLSTRRATQRGVIFSLYSLVFALSATCLWLAASNKSPILKRLLGHSALGNDPRGPRLFRAERTLLCTLFTAFLSLTPKLSFVTSARRRTG